MIVSDVIITESIQERIERFSKGGYSFFSNMPEAMRKEMMDEMHTFSQSLPPERQSQPRHEIYELAMWKSSRLLA